MAKTFTVTLADGTQIAGLELNGNNFISKKEVTKADFDGKLSHVIISGGDSELTGEHSNMELIRCQYDAGLGGYAFALRELSAAELREIEISARLDYIEMMEDLA